MENFKKSNELLEAIISGIAFDKETGLIWEHWITAIAEQVDINNIELGAEAKESKIESNCDIKRVSKRFIVRDWLSSLVEEFDCYEKAKKKYDSSIDKENECDIQLFQILNEYNNVDK